jgi:hypothetical protein
MQPRPLIVYVPGLLPKPRADVHLKELLRCLAEGIRRIDEKTAAAIVEGDAFRLVNWNHDFYGEYRDIDLDLADIAEMLTKRRASDRDIADAASLKRRFARWLFQTADYIPFLIPHFATEEVEIHLRDFNQYLRNSHGIAENARDKVRSALQGAADAGRPVLLLAHSMGSVIAYESLWQLSRELRSDMAIDLFVTTGSPLGQNIVQRHLMGSHEKGEGRYPANIRQWINIAAVGELTAIDTQLANDFAEMIELGLLTGIDDRESFNYYRTQGKLSVHSEYGYLLNEVIAEVICQWWHARTVA